MNKPVRRKELQEEYKQSRPEAGVYRIVNSRNYKSLLGSAVNLPSVRNRVEFAKSTATASALDHRLGPDVQAFGFDAFSFEVLEVLDVSPEMTSAQIRADLATLEALWREKLDPDLLY